MDRSQFAVRIADRDDLSKLPSLEAAADAMFHDVDIILPPGQMTVEELAAVKVVFVIGAPIVGLAVVDDLDGNAHLSQIAVLPARRGEGFGSALLMAAKDWARSADYAVMTLTTFRDVPWNGPCYRRRGFVDLDDDALLPDLVATREHEREIGLDDLGRRLAMRLDLS